MSGLPPPRAALPAADAPSAARPPGVRGDQTSSEAALRCLPAPPPALLSAIHFSEEKQAPKAEVPSSSLPISACRDPGQRATCEEKENSSSSLTAVATSTRVRLRW